MPWPPTPSSTRKKLILFADDHDCTARTLASLLERECGYDGTAAKSGTEALKSALDRLPYACVLDIDMPHIGGLEAAHKMRFLFGNRRPILVAATEVNTAPDARRSGLFDFLIRKPVDVERLLALLDRFKD